MKTTKKFSLAVLGTLFTLGLATTALAEEAKPTADLNTAFLSQYVWRGFAFSRDSLVIQPSMTAAYKGVGVNLWGNLDTKQYSVDPEADKVSNFNETDLTLSYDGSAGIFGYGAGYILYNVDGVPKDSQEFYAKASVSTLLTPTLTVYKETTGIQGWYAKLGIGHTLELTKDVKLALGASAGYLDDENDYNALHDGVLSATLSVPVATYITVSPQLYYSFPLSSKAKEFMRNYNSVTIDKTKADFIYGGVAVDFAF
ncbi:MAG: hypothetical protein HGA96_11755 [Desulfobulbaceae bacterium]|nr:hypothetical protein [Desulfobulbaceae bacterium]